MSNDKSVPQIDWSNPLARELREYWKTSCFSYSGKTLYKIRLNPDHTPILDENGDTIFELDENGKKIIRTMNSKEVSWACYQDLMKSKRTKTFSQLCGADDESEESDEKLELIENLVGAVPSTQMESASLKQFCQIYLNNINTIIEQEIQTLKVALKLKMLCKRMLVYNLLETDYWDMLDTKQKNMLISESKLDDLNEKLESDKKWEHETRSIRLARFLDLKNPKVEFTEERQQGSVDKRWAWSELKRVEGLMIKAAQPFRSKF